MLGSLWLMDNEIRELPPSLRSLPGLSHLYLHGNGELRLSRENLGPDPRKQGNVPPNCPALLDYYFATKKDSRPLNEVKLLLIGRGGAGKTATLNRLVANEFQPGTEETFGIDIRDWRLDCPGGEAVAVHVWDFAGQSVTHGLHSHFFSQRSVYVLVLSGREGTAQEDAEYWLKLIEANAAERGEDGMPPVLVTLNHWESGHSRADVDRKGLQEKYPWIAGWVETDCKTGHGFDRGPVRLPHRLNELIGGMEWVRAGFPVAWHRAKEWIAGMKEDYMPYASFESLCTEELSLAAKEVRSLAVLLHRLGIALNFGDDPRLQDPAIMNPHWVTGCIYKVLRLVPSALMNAEDVARVLPDEPPAMRACVVELMRRFDQAFPLPDREGWYLVPARLPQEQPDGIAEEFGPDAANPTRLRISVHPLPRTILPAFVSRTHLLSDGLPGWRWAKGVVLQHAGARAAVRADYADRIVTITLTGAPADRPVLSNVCRRELRALFSEIPGLNPKEEMEVRRGVWADVALMEELERQTSAKLPVLDAGRVEMVPVKPQLDAIAPPDARDAGVWKPSVFVSYAHREEESKDELEMRLKILQAAGWAGTVWTDRMLEPGESWGSANIHNLKQADIVLLLLSRAALASDYIRKKEYGNAKEGALVVPVILERCPWQEFAELSKLKALPKDAKPLGEWKPNRNAGWRDVMERLVAKIEVMQRQGK